MRIELSWTISASDLRPSTCCVCRRRYERGVIEADLTSDSDRLHLGEVCPACLEQGAEYMERRMHSNLLFSIMLSEAQIYMEKRAVEEDLEVCPSWEEYRVFEAGCGGSRHATADEAQAAWERGEW